MLAGIEEKQATIKATERTYFRRAVERVRAEDDTGLQKVLSEYCMKMRPKIIFSKALVRPTEKNCKLKIDMMRNLLAYFTSQEEYRLAEEIKKPLQRFEQKNPDFLAKLGYDGRDKNYK